MVFFNHTPVEDNYLHLYYAAFQDDLFVFAGVFVVVVATVARLQLVHVVLASIAAADP